MTGDAVLSCSADMIEVWSRLLRSAAIMTSEAAVGIVLHRTLALLSPFTLRTAADVVILLLRV